MPEERHDNSRLIAGRYRLGARLGRGGMGTVWRATDELLGREVAVKELHLDHASTGLSAALREARTVAQIKHPHVIVLHDVVEEDERPYLVMELVDGGSLADRLATQGPVDTREAARIGLALLGALRTAHARGVLHRDLKPANVLMEAGSGRVVLTDFGIAQVSGATTLTETGSFVGSPEYTAPERMQGAKAGPEADLWSLGVLLCTALSGESPFHRDSLGGVLHAVVQDEIRPPAAAGPLLPVVRGLLERDTARRIDATEAERLLRAYVTTGRSPAYTPTDRVVAAEVQPNLRPDVPPNLRPAPRPWTRKRTVLIAVLLVVAIGGAGAAVAALLPGRGDGGGDDGRAGAGPSRTLPVAPTRAATPTHASVPSRATATATATPTATATATATVSAPVAPAGYRIVADPQGFTLAVPEGFTRSTDDKRVFYTSPGDVTRIGIRVQPSGPGGPLAEMNRSHADGPSNTPGYRDGRVSGTTRNGLPAAFWEFTWNGFTAAERQTGGRHTYDICWEEGGLLYDVWVSAPVGSQDEARAHFDAALDSFTQG
ncbi:serine/threonine protein kinase [Streptomyces sp. A3M-1-3]|uniref:serine/threonine-protein kinase n=1 Tax=Streptomyces sp. A3M-1-3 TaxID=2962044 RepID=UPI0020B7A077|nr:serine/threonine-protein kinase [Streptomyces sp. A3M-1-3]MCP3819954.1 serine/threonine protein kinase [Streptomyces sp. A3M-1-3]